MPNALFAPRSVAHYNFLDGYISLADWDSSAKARFEPAMALPDNTLPTPQCSGDRALLMHELTHFLDATTTTWGLEMAWRKIHVVNRITEGGEGVEEAVGVLMLNLGEIVVHHAHHRAPMVDTLGDDIVMAHSVGYDARFGTAIHFHYQRRGAIVHSVALSILSVLEAHAYANETLLCMADSRRNPDLAVAAVDCRLIERRLCDSLKDPAIAEYTVLIRLVRLHFPEIGAQGQLKLVVALARFSLDVDALTLARIAGAIGFQNAYLGDALAMEMRRGSARAVVFLKTLFGLHAAVQADRGPEILDLLQNAPATAVAQFWSERFDGAAMLDDFEAMLNRLPRGPGLLDEQVFTTSARRNRVLLKDVPAAFVPFRQFEFPDLLLGDNTPVRPPNRLDIDVEATLDLNLPALGRLQTMCDESKVRRFHMAPEEVRRTVAELRQKWAGS